MNDNIITKYSERLDFLILPRGNTQQLWISRKPIDIGHFYNIRMSVTYTLNSDNIVTG